MRRQDRPIPFPRGTDAYRQEFLRLKAQGWTWRGIRQLIRCANNAARWSPLPGERCGAHAKSTGKPCMAKAGPNGRCRVHGSSRGPTTPEGKAKALLNLRQYRK